MEWKQHRKISSQGEPVLRRWSGWICGRGDEIYTERSGLSHPGRDAIRIGGSLGGKLRDERDHIAWKKREGRKRGEWEEGMGGGGNEIRQDEKVNSIMRNKEWKRRICGGEFTKNQNLKRGA